MLFGALEMLIKFAELVEARRYLAKTEELGGAGFGGEELNW